MAETIQAIQCVLENYGTVLWPVPPGDEPLIITDENLMRYNPRRFDNPNRHGDIYHYKRLVDKAGWCFDRFERGTHE